MAVAGVSMAVALAVAAVLLAPEPAGDLPAGSSLSKAGKGSAAAYLTLQALGHSVSRSHEPLALLNVVPSSAVVILAEPSQEASAGDRRAVQSLVAAGATVIATGCLGGSFFAEGVARPSGEVEPRQFSTLIRSPLTAGVPTIAMDARCLRPDFPPRFLGLYGDAKVEVVRVSRFGSGLAIWWAGNTPIANATIDAPGHLELLLNAIGPASRTILWDEFYHGQHRSLYSYARTTPLPAVAMQLGLVAAIAGLMYARRRGPVLDRVTESRVSPLEFVDTMGALYSRANAAAEAIQMARMRLRRLLTDATGMAASVDDERLAAAAAARTSVSETELRQLLRATAVSNPGIQTEEALSLVKRIQACAAAIPPNGG